MPSPPFERIGPWWSPRYRDADGYEWGVGPDWFNLPFMPFTVIEAARQHDKDCAKAIEEGRPFYVANAAMIENMQADDAWPTTLILVGLAIGLFGVVRFAKWGALKVAGGTLIAALLLFALMQKRKRPDDSDAV